MSQDALQEVFQRFEEALAKLHEQFPLSTMLDVSRLTSRFQYLGSEPLLDSQHRVLGFVTAQTPGESADGMAVVYPISQLLTSAEKVIEASLESIIITDALGCIEFVNPAFTETTGWTLSYSPEYRRLESDPNLLVRLATISGGNIASADPADAFAHDLRATHASRPIWQWLVLLAALLLPFDIASRRLIITRQDLLRLREWILVRLNLGRPTAPKVAVQATPRMQALLKAKDRAAESTKSASTTPMPPIEVQGPPEQPVSPPVQEIDQPPVIEPEKPSQKEPVAPETSTSTTTASLLERKKALRKKRE